MKLNFEKEDIQAIAEEVVKMVKPMLLDQNRKMKEHDEILDVKALAEYIGVDEGWVYKQVSFGALPYFKAGKYTRFKRRDIDRWIESQSVKPVSPFEI